MDGNLTLISRVRNMHGKPFSFSFAYRSYLSVSEISEVRVEGLETMDYFDNLCQRERFTEQGDVITFESEFDRVYLSSPKCVAVLDHQRKRTFVIRKEGLPDVVVWNPWEKKSKAMADMGDDEYKQMVSVDGAVLERPVTLKPGEEWKGRLNLETFSFEFYIELKDQLFKEFQVGSFMLPFNFRVIFFIGTFWIVLYVRQKLRLFTSKQHIAFEEHKPLQSN